MTDLLTALGALIVGAGLGVAGFALRQRIALGGVRARSELLLKDARAEQARVLRQAEADAKELLLNVEREHEAEARKARDELSGQEKRLRHRETNVERKNELLERRERQLKKSEATIEADEKRAQALLGEAEATCVSARQELERVAGFSRDDAKKRLIEAVEEQARRETAARVKTIEDQARQQAQERAVRVIAGAIQRYAGEFVAERTVSVVELPSDDMKGRIIGREGRNIRAIEAATGVDVIIDDTPEAVIVSGFNPVRREIARLSLVRLIADGRIHPARIEEIVAKVSEEMDGRIARYGEQAALDLGLHGVHPELLKLVGKLKFRNVSGQNLWNHSVETAAIAGMIAAELDVNVVSAKRAGLLHDIGRAIGHEVEGDHANVAADYARRFGERPEVVEAIRGHHDPEHATVLGVLLQSADTLSKARPGARREILETYIKRLEDLERIGMSFKGVTRAFAIQAGTEVRVLVDFEQVSDEDSYMLARDIARRIEDELTYPGEVRVTVIREARASEVAH